MTKIMLDLETFGTTPGSVIAAIGAVEFDTNSGQLGRAFYCRVDVGDAQKRGLTIDADTVRWWMRQSEAARMEIAVKDSIPLYGALLQFEQYVAACETEAEIWGNGAGFDNVLLQAAYRVAGKPTPWRHYNDRCFRTLKALYMKPEPPRAALSTLIAYGLVVPPEMRMEEFPPHHALGDAIHQAVWALSIYGKNIT